jgi:hypothetical protein
MKKSSEDIQISLSSSRQELEEILDNMIDIVESDLWISVEDGFNKNSYWIPATNDEDLDDWDVIGIIEIDVENDLLNKIISLSHEVGHYFLDQDRDFGGDNHIMFTESLAWYLGYKYFKRMGYSIEMSIYIEEANKCLTEYVRSLNDTD